MGHSTAIGVRVLIYACVGPRISFSVRLSAFAPLTTVLLVEPR